MRAFAVSDITSPVDQVTTIPFLLECDVVEYYHSSTKVVQDDWFELMRVWGQGFVCISHEPVYLPRMLTLRESEFPLQADYVKEFRSCVIKWKVIPVPSGWVTWLTLDLLKGCRMTPSAGSTSLRSVRNCVLEDPSASIPW